jgi:outer membrane protein OmpA-like peptidoglycan-associated protein
LFFCSTGYGQVTDTLVIRFGSNRSALPEHAQEAIDSVLSIYGHGRRLVAIELYGHCDNIGSDWYNDSLSRARIQAVRKYLRLKVLFTQNHFQNMNAYGKRRPLNDNRDEKKRSLNRRVEIVFHSENSSPAGEKPESAIENPKPATKTEDPTGSKEDSPGMDHPEPLTLTDALRDTINLVGKSIVLRNVNFYGDRHFPLPESYYELDNLLKLLIARPGLSIEIQGYVCCMSEHMDGYDANTRTADLSVQRAKFVYTHLLQEGIQASRMSYKGFGASHKLYPKENNERERELNRRVEIKVLSW